MTTRQRGRPRAPETDERILAAALRLLDEVGYARMSLDDVAELAGVTRPTIYRRYANKAELASAALESLRLHTPLPTETGDTRSDLIAQLRHFQQGVARPYGMSVIAALLVEEREAPELLALYRQRIVAPRRQMLGAALEHARARGDLKPGADLEAACALLIGSYYSQIIAGAPLSEDWAERAVDTLLAGVSTHVDER